MIIRETNSCICTKMFSLFLPHFIKIYFAYLRGAKIFLKNLNKDLMYLLTFKSEKYIIHLGISRWL